MTSRVSTMRAGTSSSAERIAGSSESWKRLLSQKKATSCESSMLWALLHPSSAVSGHRISS